MTYDEERDDYIIPISIHMPHTWHDAGVLEYTPKCSIISIHMPHTWHDALAHSSNGGKS